MWQGCSAWWPRIPAAVHLPVLCKRGFSLVYCSPESDQSVTGNVPHGEPSWCKLVCCMHEPCVLYFPHVREKQHTVVEISMPGVRNIGIFFVTGFQALKGNYLTQTANKQRLYLFFLPYMFIISVYRLYICKHSIMSKIAVICMCILPNA